MAEVSGVSCLFLSRPRATVGVGIAGGGSAGRKRVLSGTATEMFQQIEWRLDGGGQTECHDRVGNKSLYYFLDDSLGARLELYDEFWIRLGREGEKERKDVSLRDVWWLFFFFFSFRRSNR